MISDNSHNPVLLQEVLEWLAPIEGGTFIDGTFGGGGYSKAILGSKAASVIGIDRDPVAQAHAAALQQEFGDKLTFVQTEFEQMDEKVKQQQKAGSLINGIVFDLGISSNQLDDSERGFSFRNAGPLDMRMGPSGPTAADILANLKQDELADIIYKYGEERKSRLIAKLIVEQRAIAPLTNTQDLLKIVERVYPTPPQAKRNRSHPAFRTFQAFRIYLNRELEQLENVLPKAAQMLAPGGKLVLVTFHSMEDRIVKQFMRAAAKDGINGIEFVLPFKKVVKPSDEEVELNSRSRSAKLRVLQRAET